MTTREEFEFLMNNQVGKLINTTWYSVPDEKRNLGGGKVEYIIRSKQTSCEWAFVVDEYKGEILEWRYISEPSSCKLMTSPSW